MLGLVTSCIYNNFQIVKHAGEQEKPAENLQQIHADTIRKEVDALNSVSAISETNGKESEPAVVEAEIVEEEPLMGPILPEAEDDPYNLPITHEVTLEGAHDFLPCLEPFKRAYCFHCLAEK